MATERTRSRARERIEGLAADDLDLVSFWRAVTPSLEAAIPHYMAPCFFTLDPASLLATSHFHEGLPEIPSEWLATEYEGDDVNRMADVARMPRGLQTLHEATGGDPSRSPRYVQEIRPYGGEQEVICALRAGGEVWGCLGLYRAVGDPMFDDDDLRFLTDIAPALARGARRGLLSAEAREPEGPDAPGLVVVDPDGGVESMTPGTERWLDDLPGGDWSAGVLPAAVLSVAGQARRGAEARAETAGVALARVVARSGRWVVLHGAPLRTGGPPRVAVIVEPAHPARIAPILMAAYGLSEREQDVTRLVLRGESTTAIAKRLVVSPHTVQEHLKRVFEKTGVHSRRDLVGRVFFAHYEPRVRDNERRTIDGRPSRGGPLGPG